MLPNQKEVVEPELNLKKVDIVLDTDTYNEVDDQFALVYALRSIERLNVKSIYAVPFFNAKSKSPGDGMEKSYEEILRVLSKMKYQAPSGFVKKGSRRYLRSVSTPCENDATYDLIEKAMSADDVLYVVAIGALTNVASAILIEPQILKKIVVVWLGGHAFGWPDTAEFNLKQDVLAANVVFDSRVPLVLLPCRGVVSHLSTTVAELSKFIEKNSPIGAYLTQLVRDYEGDKVAHSKVIWDVAAVAYLVNPDWIYTRVMSSPRVSSNLTWDFDETRHSLKYAYGVNRDAIFADLFEKISRG
ncbi:MAG: nucleoside hydrolase [Clostridia bacterium]|jgi:purine nucleosidase|nr:nucleoside hydrolase [Clostridia bacterium]MBT7122667.1 nucleoside hydrolase [Clostridia bacterium]